MTSILSGLFQTAPLWSLSLLSFVPLFLKVLNNNKEAHRAVVSGIFALAILLSAVLFIFIGFNDNDVLLLRFDNYSSGACLLVAVASLFSLSLFHTNLWLDKKQYTEILFFLCQGLLGLYVFCLAQNLMLAFVGLELASLMIYINLSMSQKDKFCLEAAIKYFILSALAGIFFLYGLSFLFGIVGSLDLNDIFVVTKTNYFYNRFFYLAWLFIFCALFFKIALFPFHLWLADVYQGALSPMTAFMALAVKSSIVLFLGKLFSQNFFEHHGSLFLTGLGIAGVLTVLSGSLMALNQIKLKRLLAFSSLTHSGYLMMGLYGVLNLNQEAKELSWLFYYLLSYIFLSAGLMLVFQIFENKSSQAELKDLKGLFKNHPILALGLSVFLLALAGLPPTFGFFAKLGLFQPLILSGSWWLMFWAFVGSGLGLYYYIKPITIMMDFDTNQATVCWSNLTKGIFLILLCLSLFGSWLFGLYFY